MYFVIRFVIRCVASLLFLAIVLALITVIAKIYMVAGEDATLEQTALAATMVFLAVTPGFIVLCVARGDGRWERWRAMLLIQLPLTVVSLIWMSEAGPSFWAGNFYQAGESSAVQGMAHGLLLGGLMFLSGFLVAFSLPSLRRKATGQRPRLVWLFVALFLFAMFLPIPFFLSETSTQIDYSGANEVLRSLDLDFLMAFLGGSILISFLLEAALVLWVAFGGSLVARALLVAYFFNFVLQATAHVPEVGGESFLYTLFYWLMLAIQGVGLGILYTPDVNQWFTGGPVPALAGSAQKRPPARREHV